MGTEKHLCLLGLTLQSKQERNFRIPMACITSPLYYCFGIALNLQFLRTAYST